MKSEIHCALCGSDEVTPVAEVDRDGNPLRNVICDSCGLVWVDPRPGNSEIDEFYSEKYRSEYKGEYEPKMKHCWREMHRAIDRLVLLSKFYTPGAEILDIGAGAGFFAYVVRENKVELDGIEPNKGYSQFAQHKLGLDKVATGYLNDVSEADHYDLITINHVFEHLPDPNDSLQQMRKLLKDRGRIIMEVPSIKATYHSPNKVFHVGHLYWYSPETISAMAIKNGFKVIHLELTEGTEHVSLVLEKQDAIPSDNDWLQMCDGQAGEIKSFLASRSVAGHYMTSIPYVRFVKKMKMYLNEQKQIKGFDEKLSLIQSIPVPQVLNNQ